MIVARTINMEYSTNSSIYSTPSDRANHKFKEFGSHIEYKDKDQTIDIIFHDGKLVFMGDNEFLARQFRDVAITDSMKGYKTPYHEIKPQDIPYDVWKKIFNDDFKWLLKEVYVDGQTSVVYALEWLEKDKEKFHRELEVIRDKYEYKSVSFVQSINNFFKELKRQFAQ